MPTATPNQSLQGAFDPSALCLASKLRPPQTPLSLSVSWH